MWGRLWPGRGRTRGCTIIGEDSIFLLSLFLLLITKANTIVHGCWNPRTGKRGLDRVLAIIGFFHWEPVRGLASFWRILRDIHGRVKTRTGNFETFCELQALPQNEKRWGIWLQRSLLNEDARRSTEKTSPFPYEHLLFFSKKVVLHGAIVPLLVGCVLITQKNCLNITFK